MLQLGGFLDASDGRSDSFHSADSLELIHVNVSNLSHSSNLVHF